MYTYIYVCIDTGLVFFIAFMNTRLDRQLSYKISCLGPSDLLPTTRSTQIKSATADWLVLILWLWKPIRYYFFFFILLLDFHVSQNYLHFLYSYILLKTYTNVQDDRERWGGMKKTLIKNNQRGSRGNIYTGV